MPEAKVAGWNEARARALELQRERLEVLVALYGLQGGDEQVDTTWQQLLERSNHSQASLERTWRYLFGEHLVTGNTAGRIAISHVGIVELERALTRPEEPTEHFPAPMIFFGPVGAVQTAPGAMADVEQKT